MIRSWAWYGAEIVRLVIIASVVWLIAKIGGF